MPRLRRPDPDAQRFGSLVARQRLALGWEKRKLAVRIGVTPQYLAILEEGLNIPSLTVVLDLIEVLGMDAGETMRELLATRNKATQ